jgi:hypothetical protein
MDDSFTSIAGGSATVPPNTNHITAATATATATSRQQPTMVVSDSDTHLARQSRHSISRIISATNTHGSVGVSQSSAQQQQQHQLLGGEALLKSGYLMTQQQYNNYLAEKRQAQQQQQQQAQQLSSRGAVLSNSDGSSCFDNLIKIIQMG